MTSTHQASTTDHFHELCKGLSDHNPRMRAACVQELGKMGEAGASAAGTAEKTLELFDDSDASVQSAAIRALGEMGQPGAAHSDRIMSKVDSPQADIRQAAIQALGRLGERAAKHAGSIETCLEDKDPDTVGDACVTLGSMKAKSCAKKLAAKLQDRDSTVVASALVGLARLDMEVEAVGKMLSHESARVRAATLNSLAQMSDVQSLAPAVAKCVADPDGYVRIAAVNFISCMGDKASGQVRILAPMLQHQNPGIRALSAMALVGLKGGAEFEILAEVDAVEALLADEEEDLSTVMLAKAGVQPKVAPEFRKPCCAAASLLGALGPSAQVSCAKVAAGLSSPDHEMRVLCALALGKMGGDQFEGELVDLLEDPVPLVIAAACSALGAMASLPGLSASAPVAEKVAECLEDKSPVVRAAAAEALGKMGDELLEHLDVLVRKMDDPVWTVRAACVEAISSPSSGERGQMFAADICRHIFDQDYQVRIASIEALTRMGERGAAFAEEVVSLLQDPLPDIRISALKALAAFGPVTAGLWKNEIERVSREDMLDSVRAGALNTLDTFTALAGIADAE